jgi:hypothetical protein
MIMTDKTLVDVLFDPVFPSLRLWFLRYRKSVLLERGYVELEQMADIKKRHKATTTELDAICKELRSA